MKKCSTIVVISLTIIWMLTLALILSGDASHNGINYEDVTEIIGATVLTGILVCAFLSWIAFEIIRDNEDDE